MPKTPGKMHMSNMVKIDKTVEIARIGLTVRQPRAIFKFW